MTATIDAAPAVSAEVTIEVPLPVPVDRAWAALIEAVDAWWPDGFYMTPEPRRMVFEPRPGGRLAEESDSGAGLLWYTVIALDPPNSIQMAGHIFPAFGGPATSFVHIRFEAADEGTSILKLTDSLIGRIEPDNPARIEQGWRSVFERAFAEYLAQ